MKRHAVLLGTAILLAGAHPALSAPWATDLREPPVLENPLIVENICPGEAGWPTPAQSAGRDLKFILPKNRDCVLRKADDADGNLQGTNIGGTQANPARNIHWIGGRLITPDSNWTKPATAGRGAIHLTFIKGTVHIEGVSIDVRCTCRDTIANEHLGYPNEKGVTLTGPQPLEKTPTIVIQNTYLSGTTQCKPGGHGDSHHSRGSGTLPYIYLQNVYAKSAFQSLFWENKPLNSFPGHGFARAELDHVYLEDDPDCGTVPEGVINTGAKISWYRGTFSTHPGAGIYFKSVFVKMLGGNWAYVSVPAAPGWDANKCTTPYPASAGLVVGKICQGAPPEGSPAPLGMVGRNYSRAAFQDGSQPVKPVIFIEAMDSVVERGTGGVKQRIKVKRTGDTSKPSTVQFSTSPTGTSPALESDFFPEGFPSGTVTFDGD